VFVRKDDDIVSEDDQRIAQFSRAALAILEAFVREDIGLRPEPQKGLAA
jgi:hypothetical protein